jgi:hypothetical protein
MISTKHLPASAAFLAASVILLSAAVPVGMPARGTAAGASPLKLASADGSGGELTINNLVAADNTGAELTINNVASADGSGGELTINNVATADNTGSELTRNNLG